MNEAVSPGALSTLFTDARTHNGWRETPVSDETLREIYALMKWGPTSANCSPARIVFTRTAEGKERLRPALSSGNLQKTLTAPVTAIVAWDSEFYEPRQPGGCKLKTAPVRPVVAARPAEYVCSEDLFY